MREILNRNYNEYVFLNVVKIYINVKENLKYIVKFFILELNVFRGKSVKVKKNFLSFYIIIIIVVSKYMLYCLYIKYKIYGYLDYINFLVFL